MSYAPQTLDELASYWEAHGGVALGIVGDTRHRQGYHLGRDRIYSSAGRGALDYSVQLERDKAGLTDAASAMDLGKLGGTLEGLRLFSRWLVSTLSKDPAARHDFREVIYSPDGATVQRYSAIDNAIHTGPGNGDDSHLTHTHLSYLRDSETREKVSVFRPYFEDEMRSIIVGSDRVLGDVAAGVPYYEAPNGKQVGTTGAMTAEWLGSPTLDDGTTRDTGWCLIVGLSPELERVPGVARYIRRDALVNPRPWPANDCSKYVAAIDQAIATLEGGKA